MFSSSKRCCGTVQNLWDTHFKRNDFNWQGWQHLWWWPAHVSLSQSMWGATAYIYIHMLYHIYIYMSYIYINMSYIYRIFFMHKICIYRYIYYVYIYMYIYIYYTTIYIYVYSINTNEQYVYWPGLFRPSVHYWLLSCAAKTKPILGILAATGPDLCFPLPLNLCRMSWQ